MSGLNVWLDFRPTLSTPQRSTALDSSQAEYVFDPSTFVRDEWSTQMRYRPTVESEFSILVVLHRGSRIGTFKYRVHIVLSSPYHRIIGRLPSADSSSDECFAMNCLSSPT
jgi:hypothetical protein